MAGATDGYAPNSPLLLNADGLLYGTTGSGGVDGYGTVFSISKTGAFNVVHSFTRGPMGHSYGQSGAKLGWRIIWRHG